MTDRELATVLASLRFWQQHLADKETMGFADCPIPDHFDNGIAPLNTAEIDDLCVRLNFGDDDGEKSPLRVKTWISKGTLAEHYDSADEILGDMGDALDAARADEIPDTVLFLGDDDRWYTVAIEACLDEAEAGYVHEVVENEINELEIELQLLLGLDGSSPQSRAAAFNLNAKLADLRGILANLAL